MIRRFSLPALASCLSAAGLGWLIWLGISVALLQGRSGDMVLLRSVQHTGLMLACVMTLFAAITLRSAPMHAKAARWRWASIAAGVLTLLAGLGLMMVLTRRPPDPGWNAVFAAVMSLGAVATVLCLGMYTATGGRAAWKQQMVVPNALAYALLAGAALLFALLALKWPGQGLLATPAPSLITLVMVVAASKLLYWFENGGLRAGLSGVSDAYVLRMRLLVLALLAGFPLLATLALLLWPLLAPRLGWSVIALSILAGGYLEQQLLAAEAGTRPVATNP